MNQLTLFENKYPKLINLKEASQWASKYLNRNITNSNISYLIQYGRIKKHGDNGNPLIDIDELKKYYDSYDKEKKDLNNFLTRIKTLGVIQGDIESGKGVYRFVNEIYRIYISMESRIYSTGKNDSLQLSLSDPTNGKK